MVDFRSSVAAALRSRLAPNTGVARKQLAAACGVSSETVRSWLDGRASIKAEHLALAASIMPGLIEKAFGLVTSPRNWFTTTSTLPVIGSLADAVRRHLKLPPLYPGDLCAYAEKNLGWISAETRESIGILGYDDGSVSKEAAALAAEWLRASRLESVLRRIRIDDRIIERTDDPNSAADSILRAAEIVASPFRMPWRIERLSLTAIPEFAPLIKAWHVNPSAIIEVAAAMGKLPRCSILRVKGGEVETLEIGSEVPFKNKGELVGRNVLDRADLRYGTIVREHMLGCVEGPTVHRLRGSIFETPWSYDRLALYSGVEAGSVCLSVPLRHDRAEALADAIGVP